MATTEVDSTGDSQEATVWITEEIPSGTGFKKVRRIHQKDKDMVYGYIKSIQILLPSDTNSYYTIDQLIQDLCLLYFSCVDFEDKYDIMEQIGDPGQFGRAYKCKSTSDGATFAVKEISKTRLYQKDLGNNIRESIIRSMKNEVNIISKMNHKYIIKFQEVFETRDKLYIVQEECKGGELFDRIKSKRRYPESDVKPIIRMVCEAVYYMQEEHRVVHCDIGPDDILFLTEAEDSIIKIIDFGMSKVLPRLRSLRELCGTPYYTAPEIINGDYAHAADMWSIGVITYIMIFGFPPFYVDPNQYHGIQETKEIYKSILRGFNPEVRVK